MKNDTTLNYTKTSAVSKYGAHGRINFGLRNLGGQELTSVSFSNARLFDAEGVVARQIGTLRAARKSSRWNERPQYA